MKSLNLGRYALLSCVAAAMLAGCGGSQPPIGATDMRHPAIRRATSSGSALLYVVMGESQVHMLTYPGLKPVGHIRGTGRSASNPNNGDVLIGSFLYAHGGTTPLHTFDPGSNEYIYDGAFDPTSDAIAFTVNEFEGAGSVYVYQTTASNPTKYTVPNIPYVVCVGYDGQGNLFVDGVSDVSSGLTPALAELPKGGSAFVDLTIDGALKTMRAIQWDGSNITVVNGSSIYRLQISGSTATIVGQTKLVDVSGGLGEFWIQGNTVIAAHISDRPHPGRWVGFWHYPAGGRAYKVIQTISKNRHDRMLSATVSVAPSSPPFVRVDLMARPLRWN